MIDPLALLFIAGGGSFLATFILATISIRKGQPANRHPNREIYNALLENNRRKWQREPTP